MKNSKKLFIVLSICAGVAVVAASVDIMTSKNTTFNLRPGFKRRSTIVYSSSAKPISEKCFRSRLSDGQPEYFPPTSDYPLYRHREQHVLVLEEDFNTSITITVKAKKWEQDSKEPDPAIIIRSLSGKMLICDDYYDDHGSTEILNTDDQYNSSDQLYTGNSNLSGFEPKAGTYLMEIWSYYQPIKTYEIVITEDQ